jgi:acetylornithine deacetylase/succinyl-diaminopimelate desuccinylase-like protein
VASVEVAALAEASRGASVDFGTEAGLYQAALQVPVVVCGPGDMAQAHVADEYLGVDQLDRAERFYIASPKRSRAEVVWGTLGRLI